MSKENDKTRKGEPPYVPTHFQEPHIVVTVPKNTPLPEIEAQIHEALIQQPPDVLVKNRTKELLIMLQTEGNNPPPPDGD